jgi:hypothetical protein
MLDKRGVEIIQEVLSGEDTINLMFTFHFASMPEGATYWHDQANADALTPDARGKLEAMLKAYHDTAEEN